MIRGLSIAIEVIMSRRVLAVAIVSMLLPLVASSTNSSRAAELQSIEIATKNGVRPFEVEMAVTPEETTRGLMFRRELPEGHGMLFDFHRDQEVSFWMKNTYISLDMIFIRSDEIGRAHV